MIGDKLLIYNENNGMFYTGPSHEETQVWCEDIEHAYKGVVLDWMHKKVSKLGDGTRIISETAARKIVSMRNYRSVNSGTKGSFFSAKCIACYNSQSTINGDH